MQQYFVPDQLKIDEQIVLNIEQSNHIIRVLRMHDDDVIRLSNQVVLMLAKIKVEKNMVVATCFEDITKDDSFKYPVTLFLSMLKGDKWDYTLQKVTELGVSKIIPVVTERTIVKITDNSQKKTERWNKIVLEAAEQSHRLTFPIVTEPILIKDIQDYEAEINIVAYELAEDKLLQELVSKNQSIAIFIGPEGGFSEKEISFLRQKGFMTCSLGQRILRAETAAIYAMSVINCLFGI